MRIASAIFMVVMMWLPSLAQAQLRVFACEPEWASLTNELGGEHVNVYTATTALQDPHHIEARPSLIAKMRRADLVVCTGADLEVGWLPLLVRQASNSKVLQGQPGYFEAAQQVERLGIPEQVDRSMGDVHAAGNPHVHLDPRRVSQIAQALSQRLITIDPNNKAAYEQYHQSFQQRWSSAMKRWQQTAKALAGVDVAVYHANWTYLFDWLKINVVIDLEPKPGISPSAGYLAQVKQTAQQQQVKMVVYAAYQDDKAAKWLSNALDIPHVKLPYTIGANEQVSDLFSLYEQTLQQLIAAASS